MHTSHILLLWELLDMFKEPLFNKVAWHLRSRPSLSDVLWAYYKDKNILFIYALYFSCNTATHKDEKTDTQKVIVITQPKNI